jgi:Rieske Fe-S protein
MEKEINMQETNNSMKMEKKTSPNLFASGNMNVCEVCGNQYDKCMEVRLNGETHIFDSFECAIHAIAPRCAHCGCSVIGHGMEADGVFYCCAHCASQHGIHEFEDRIATERSSV